MKKQYFVVSMIKNGILGGGMTADENAIIYHTGKVTVPDAYRRLVMRYDAIDQAEAGWLLFMPTVLIRLKNGETFKFAVFFGRKRLLDLLRDQGVAVD